MTLPTEDPIIEKLTQWAQKHPAVRVALLTSSRAKENSSLDALSDYDLTLYVSDTKPFLEDRWVKDFGDLVVMYKDERPKSGITEYKKLVQYPDKKLDFTIAPVDRLQKIIEEAHLPPELDVGYRILTDKDGLTHYLKPATDTAYVLKSPSNEDFLLVVEEFLWETTYVARNLWRNELVAAKYSFDVVIRHQLLCKMLAWHIQITRKEATSLGRSGRGFKQYLAPEVWTEFQNIFVGASIEENWDALFKAAQLFRKIAQSVAAHYGYRYPQNLDDRVVHHLQNIRNLKKPTP
jgi:aminoglycoside 6-adenylyltransferase